VKASWLIYRENAYGQVPDGAYGSLHDHHVYDDAHEQSYAQDDVLARGALGDALCRRVYDVLYDAF
jgi:hypothetical protein